MANIDFGKAVRRLAEAWHKRHEECSCYPDADERKAKYLQECAEAYERICESYRAQGQEPPGPKILSGEQ